MENGIHAHCHACLLAIALILFCMPLALGSTQAPDMLDRYEVIVTIDTDEYIITGTETIAYYNATGTNLDRICINVYPNAFSNEDDAPLLSSPESAYPGGFDEGYCIMDVKDHQWSIDKTLATIFLDSPLAPGATEVVQISFLIKIPEVLHRFGHFDKTIYLGNCFPTACMYEKGWVSYPYIPIGDPFFSDISTWDVTISISSDWKLASTGTLWSVSHNGEMSTYDIVAPFSRDFACACSRDYEVLQESKSGITFYSYYLKGDRDGGKKALEISMEAIEFYEGLYGAYPYPYFTVAETYLGGAAGMEYPQMIFVDKEFYKLSEEMIFEIIVAHEVAHQWWYGVVGNDEFKDHFIDESMAQYSTAQFLEDKYGPDAYGFGQDLKENYIYYIKEKQTTPVIDLALDEYGSPQTYTMAAYTKGPLFLSYLESVIGKESFYNFLMQLYTDYSFEELTTSEFADALFAREFCNGIEQAVEWGLSSSQIPDVSASAATYDKKTVKLTYASHPEKLPIQVGILYEDGTYNEYVASGGGLEVACDSYPIEILLDPSNTLVEEDENNNMFQILEKDERNIGIFAAYIVAVIAALSIAAYILRKMK